MTFDDKDRMDAFGAELDALIQKYRPVGACAVIAFAEEDITDAFYRGRAANLRNQPLSPEDQELLDGEYPMGTAILLQAKGNHLISMVARLLGQLPESVSESVIQEFMGRKLEKLLKQQRTPNGIQDLFRQLIGREDQGSSDFDNMWPASDKSQ